MSYFQLDLTKYLSLAQKEAILSDVVISFKGDEFPCHKAILDKMSIRYSTIHESLNSSFVVDDDLDASSEDLFSVICAFYGQPLHITPSNAISLAFLSKSFGFDALYTHCKSYVGGASQEPFQIPTKHIMEKLFNDNLKDFQLIFHDQSLHIHKFLFAAISPYFRAKFSRNWQESEENTTDFTKLLQVSPSSFINFFTSFYTGKLEVNLENAFDFSHLAWYFQLSELEKFVNNFIENSESEYNWVTSLVSKAITSEDYRFIKIISTKISKIPDLSNCDPIPVHPLFFENLTSNISPHWLLKTLIFSFVQSRSTHSDIEWTEKTLSKAFVHVQSIAIYCIEPEFLYETVKPLLDLSELFDFTSSLSLNVIKKVKQQTPVSWVSWLLVQADSFKKFDMIKKLSVLLNLVIQPTSASKLPLYCFSTDSLDHLIAQCTKEHLVIWILSCIDLICSKRVLRSNRFSNILSALKLEECSFISIHNSVQQFFEYPSLKFVLSEFISTKLFNKLASDFDLIKSRFDQLKCENKLLKEKLSVSEQRNRTSGLQQSSDHGISRASSISLPNVPSSLIVAGKRRSGSNVADNAKFSPHMNSAETTNSLANASRGDGSFTNNVAPFFTNQWKKYLCSPGPRSLVSIENHSKIATKKGVENGWKRSFVQITYPSSGKLFLKLVNFHPRFLSCVGFFDPHSIYSISRPPYGLFLSSDQTAYLTGETVENRTAALALDEAIRITFTRDTVTFTFLDFMYSVNFDPNHIFGIFISHVGNSWELMT
ncbi:hypothetical protein RCL1_003247 [Eukaryota sp. TZLM3-RCL]